MGEARRRREADATGSAPPRRAARARPAGPRFGWRAIGYFMLAMLLLDVIGYAIVTLGFGRCYGLLCLIAE